MQAAKKALLFCCMSKQAGNLEKLCMIGQIAEASQPLARALGPSPFVRNT